MFHTIYSSENIKVFVRVKGPSNEIESCLKINGNTITAGDSQFSFDYVIFFYKSIIFFFNYFNN